MVLWHLLQHQKGWDVKILATDIDTSMLQKGRIGRYAMDELRHIPKPYQAYLTHDDNHIIMADALRQMVRFNHLNLLEPWPMRGAFDVIFCRNVVIYFDAATQAQLFGRIQRQLKPATAGGGWLYIGHSENLPHHIKGFEHKGRTIFQYKEAA